jgi:hypothetical protein
MNVLTVELPTLILLRVKLTLAPTLTAEDAFAVVVFRPPLSDASPVTPSVFARDAAPRTVSVPSVSIAVDVMKVLTVELPTLILAVVRLTLAPTFTAIEAFAVGVFMLPFRDARPVTPRVLESVAAPRTASVPSVSIAVDVMNVLTVLLPTVILVVFKTTFAPILTAIEAFAVGVFILPLRDASPVTVSVFDSVAAPVTPRVLERVAAPVTGHQQCLQSWH